VRNFRFARDSPGIRTIEFVRYAWGVVTVEVSSVANRPRDYERAVVVDAEVNE
jgi:hypothetical protein